MASNLSNNAAPAAGSNPLAIYVPLSHEMKSLIPKLSLKYDANRSIMDPICCIQFRQPSKQGHARIFIFKAGVYQSGIVTFLMEKAAISAYMCVTDHVFTLFHVNIANNNNDSSHLVNELQSFLDASNQYSDVKKIRQCFVDHCIDFLYFAKHKRAAFVELMQRECDLDVVLSVALWQHFVTDLRITPQDPKQGFRTESLIATIPQPIRAHLDDGLYVEMEDALDDDTEIHYAVESKLVSFYMNRDTKKKGMELKRIRRCFKAHNIGFKYFGRHKRNDFVALMKRECGLTVATAIKLWNNFVDLPYVGVLCKVGFICLHAQQIQGLHVAIHRRLHPLYDEDSESSMAIHPDREPHNDLDELEYELAANQVMIDSLWAMMNDISVATVHSMPMPLDENDSGGCEDDIELRYGDSLSTPWDQEDRRRGFDG